MRLLVTPAPDQVLVRERVGTNDWTVTAHAENWTMTVIATGMTERDSLRLVTEHNDRLAATEGKIKD